MPRSISDTFDIAEAILTEHNETIGRRWTTVDVAAGVDARRARLLNAYEAEQDRLQAEADWRERFA